MGIDTNNWELIPATKVIWEIDKSIELDWVLTKEENENIQSMYDKVDTPEWKKQVRDYIKSGYLKISENSRKLLIEEIELKSNYSMEYLKENSNSEFYNIVLNNDVALKSYKEGFIWSIIEENKELFSNHNTLDLVYWNKITKELWLKSTANFAADKVWWIFTEIIKKTWNQETFDISKMWDVLSDLWKMGDDFKNLTEKQSEKLLTIMEKIKWYLDFLTKWYTGNLNKLISIWSKNNEWLKKLLDNPVALDTVLETWKYKKDGYDIDLNTGKANFAENPDLIKSKKEFLDIVLKSTNESWKSLENLKNKWEEIINVFNKLWLKADTLRDFKETLKNIPIFWEFLSAIMWFFVSDWLLNMMDWTIWDKEFSIPWKGLQEFLTNKDNKENIPFKLEDNSFKNISNVGSIQWFLWKVDNLDRKNFENICANDKKDKTTEKRNELIKDKEIWNKIFSDKELINEPILEQIRLEVQEIKKNNKDLNIKDFFKKLSNSNIAVQELKKEAPAESKSSQTSEALIAENPDKPKIPETNIPEKTFSELLIDRKIKVWNEIKDISLWKWVNTLIIWNNTYNISAKKLWIETIKSLWFENWILTIGTLGGIKQFDTKQLEPILTELTAQNFTIFTKETDTPGVSLVISKTIA